MLFTDDTTSKTNFSDLKTYFYNSFIFPVFRTLAMIKIFHQNVLELLNFENDMQ